MTEQKPRLAWRFNIWQTVLIFGILHFVAMTIGAILVEPYSGSCMFILMGYFNAIVVILPILLLRRFGVGLGVYLPYAIVGFFPEYYMDWVVEQKLVSPWAALGWSLLGLLIGLSADLAFKLLPGRLNERWRTMITGSVLGLTIFVTTVLSFTTLYADPSTITCLPHYQEGIYFSLPWLIVNGAFGGYTAYAIYRSV